MHFILGASPPTAYKQNFTVSLKLVNLFSDFFFFSNLLKQIPQRGKISAVL